MIKKMWVLLKLKANSTYFIWKILCFSRFCGIFPCDRCKIRVRLCRWAAHFVCVSFFKYFDVEFALWVVCNGDVSLYQQQTFVTHLRIINTLVKKKKETVIKSCIVLNCVSYKVKSAKKHNIMRVTNGFSCFRIAFIIDL